MGFDVSRLLKLRELLTSENLAFLDRLLTGLTDERTPGYREFWGWFKSGLRDPEAYAKAYRTLRQLIAALKQAR